MWSTDSNEELESDLTSLSESDDIVEVEPQQSYTVLPALPDQPAASTSKTPLPALKSTKNVADILDSLSSPSPLPSELTELEGDSSLDETLLIPPPTPRVQQVPEEKNIPIANRKGKRKASASPEITRSSKRSRQESLQKIDKTSSSIASTLQPQQETATAEELIRISESPQPTRSGNKRKSVDRRETPRRRSSNANANASTRVDETPEPEVIEVVEEEQEEEEEEEYVPLREEDNPTVQSFLAEMKDLKKQQRPAWQKEFQKLQDQYLLPKEKLTEDGELVWVKWSGIWPAECMFSSTNRVYVNRANSGS